MNEFEWRRQLRNLDQPHAPGRDLWASIDAALDQGANPHGPDTGPRAERDATAQLRPRRRPWRFAASAAAILMLAGGMGWHALQVPDAAAITDTEPTPGWKPSDPRLSGAAIELDAARMELQLALQQAPDSPALQRLLDRTERQQAQLRQLSHRAG